MQGAHLAGWGRRLGATLLDGLIIGVPALVIMGLLGIGVVGASSTESGFALILSILAAAFVSLLVIVVVTFIYAPVTMMRSGEHNGQTLGKQIFGIRVIRTTGEPMDFLWSAFREVIVKNFGVGLAGTATFGLAYLANYLWPLWDGEKRALHDMAVSTRVVRA